MKKIKTLKNMVATMAVAIGMTTLAPAAQAVELKAAVPFDFSAGGAPVPAGTYWISIAPGGSHVKVRTVEGKQIAYVLTNIAATGATASGRTARLVFRRVGAHHFLGQVWTGGGNATGNETPMSGREKALRKEVMIAGGSVGTVEIRIVAE